MFDFEKLCKDYEKMSAAERNLLITEKSLMIIKKLSCICINGIEPTKVLAGFMIASAVSDEKLSEKEYLMIYPALVRVFGDAFDFSAVKRTFQNERGIRKIIADYSEKMISVLSLFDESVKYDIITLCLCVTSIDEKISFKEKKYIKQLCCA